MSVILPVPEQRDIVLDLPEFRDADEKVSVSVRQATNSEQEYIAKEFSNREERIYSADTDDVKIVYNYNILELRRIQAYLTLTDCNIQVPDAAEPNNQDKAQPLMRFATLNGKRQVSMTKDEFAIAWGKLPQVWADAISRAIFQVNPQWNPEAKAGE